MIRTINLYFINIDEKGVDFRTYFEGDESNDVQPLLKLSKHSDIVKSMDRLRREALILRSDDKPCALWNDYCEEDWSIY
jgi:hypothetical protein